MKLLILLKLSKNNINRYFKYISVSFIFVVIVTNLSIYLRNINTTRPQRRDDVMLNPYIGYVSSAKNKSTHRDVTLVFAKVLWSEIETEEGVFDFTSFEEKNNFEMWREKGAKVILRPILDTPSEDGNLEIPLWLFDKINEDGTLYDNSYGKGFSPNYENEVLIEYHRRFMNALGERYNNDDFVAFIELGSIGHWGEWHVKYSSGIPKLPKSNVLEIYFNHYLRAFPDKVLLVRRPMDFTLGLPVGLYNDMIGNSTSTNDWLSWIANGYTSSQTNETFQPNPDFWKKGPSGGEIANGSDGIISTFSDENIANTISQIKASHTSWIGPGAPVLIKYTDDLSDNIESALKEMGYRFRVVSSNNNYRVKVGEPVSVTTKWINEGVAPMYYKWPVEILVVSNTGEVVCRSITDDDIRTWLPGEDIISTHTFVIPEDIQPGEYNIAVRIFENYESNQIIKLAQLDDIRNSNDEIIMYKIGNILIS